MELDTYETEPEEDKSEEEPTTAVHEEVRTDT